MTLEHLHVSEEGEEGKQTLAYSVLLLFLPGLPFICQGTNGLESIIVKPEDQADPVALRNEDGSDGRDGARSPIPWHVGENFGFSTVKPWLPMGDRSEGKRLIHRDLIKGRRY